MRQSYIEKLWNNKIIFQRIFQKRLYNYLINSYIAYTYRSFVFCLKIVSLSITASVFIIIICYNHMKAIIEKMALNKKTMIKYKECYKKQHFVIYHWLRECLKSIQQTSWIDAIDLIRCFFQSNLEISSDSRTNPQNAEKHEMKHNMRIST